MRRPLGVTVMLLVLMAAAAAVRVVLWRPFPVVGANPADTSGRVSGVVHIHTTASDGTGTVAQVIQAAQDAGLNFIVITDHRTFDAKGQEGYAGKVLVLVGTEISTRSGHLLAFGLPEPPFLFSDDAAEALEDVRDLGGVAVVAHPDGPREDLQWTNWNLPGSWGIEVLNGDSQWRSAGWPRTARALASLPFNSAYALLSMLSSPSATLARWDRLAADRDTPMIAGTDTHGFPSYGSLFRLWQHHLLLERPLSGDASADSAAIVSSLARGRGYIAMDALAPGGGFVFVAEQGGSAWTMGDDVPASPAPRLRAGGQLPSGAQLKLVRDGHVVLESADRLELGEAAPGVYRVEVRLPGWQIPWIVSGAIYVFSPEMHAARARRAGGPSATAPPEAARMLDDFEGATVFEAAADPSTQVSRDVLDPRAGQDGGSAARLEFTLGTPTPETPSPFAALTSARSRNLSGARGLVFSIRADHPARVEIQVRDPNAQAKDGTEWWYLSVKATTDWRRVAVPFSRFRTREAHSDGRLDLDATTGVFFIVDTGLAKPGTAGEIWLDDLGVY